MDGATEANLAHIVPLEPLQPDLHERAWASIPHPTLPLLATAHSKGATIFSLVSQSVHSRLTGGHTRSVRCVAWEPGLEAPKLCLVTGSFDSTAGLWRWNNDDDDDDQEAMEVRVDAQGARVEEEDQGQGGKEWEFTLVLEGHDSEIKSCAFSPSGAYLATCSRDKSVWIWEDVGSAGVDDEWETVAILNEHDGDVKAVAWCPDVPGRNTSSRRHYSSDVLASASYDNTVRIWREDADAEWVGVAVLEGHAATVWGVEWEARPRDKDAFPRLLTFSADATVRVWALQDDGHDGGHDANPLDADALGRVPNTMRGPLREQWHCTAVLPNAHDRDVYSVTWSAQTGLVASTGSDGCIALYRELDDAASPAWQLLVCMPNAHGPYEVNHITWCRRYDAACHHRGQQEMLVSTGDDGLIRTWHVDVLPEASGQAQPAAG
ncbi:hypothetical protein CDD82_4141 [Ophiocordyceps australis]|uniref:Probable cytosolic iron-sulfur protein assembly protein 1 n=1 Tax=Ophiocordyceps australis TaxID=1399860 RepID=A0A2C5Z8B0_9HYPO|nr:hypothetical protein CDD82_4141 [Ophiocordyceps australis]